VLFPGILASAINPYPLGSTGPGGGTVFYDAGEVQSWGRWIEVAPDNWAGSNDADTNWTTIALSNTSVGATSTALGSCTANTNLMMALNSSTSFSAGRARAYTGGGLTWSVPSREELALAFAYMTPFNSFNPFQTSSERDAGSFWGKTKSAGTFSFYGKSPQQTTIGLRPVRAFQ
jgi:hypothetical protein